MNNDDPIFRPIFGKNWDRLPPVMHKHYANRPFSNDRVTFAGKLDVLCKWYAKPLFWLSRTIPPHSEKAVSVTVSFVSQQSSAAFSFDRVFQFKNREPYRFLSHMHHVQKNEIMEAMHGGICWHGIYEWDGSSVLLKHKGYSLRLFDRNIPLPITWLVGRGDAYETAVDEYRFDMGVTMTHPLFGKIYEYKGQFSLIDET